MRWSPIVSVAFLLATGVAPLAAQSVAPSTSWDVERAQMVDAVRHDVAAMQHDLLEPTGSSGHVTASTCIRALPRVLVVPPADPIDPRTWARQILTLKATN